MDDKTFQETPSCVMSCGAEGVGNERPSVREPAAWSEYQENDRRRQKELADVETLIQAALRDITSWLLDNPSAKENTHVFSLQDRLGELVSIIARRVKKIFSPEDDIRWYPTVTNVLSVLEQIPNIIGLEVHGQQRYARLPGLARLKDELPEELPGSMMDKSRRSIPISSLASRVAKKLEDPKGNPTMTVNEAAHALGKSKPTIYRWIEEGKLDKSGVPGRVRTDSVVRLLQPVFEQ